MMHTKFLSVLALGLSALADAGFSSPKSGDKWSKGSSQTISWDSSSLSSGKCDIHLVPAGATDTTTIISEIALQVDNTGSYSWTPSSSISVAEAEIIIVDSKKTTIISSVFALISESSGSSNYGYGYGYGYDSGSKKSKSYDSKSNHTKTYEWKGHETKTYTKASETTSSPIIIVSGAYSTGSTSFTTVQVTTTVAGELTTYASTTSITPPLAASTTVASAAPFYTTSVSNGSIAVNATPTAITFSGDAPGSIKTIYGTAFGCVVGLASMLLL